MTCRFANCCSYRKRNGTRSSRHALTLLFGAVLAVMPPSLAQASDIHLERVLAEAAAYRSEGLYAEAAIVLRTAVAQLGRAPELLLELAPLVARWDRAEAISLVRELEAAGASIPPALRVEYTEWLIRVGDPAAGSELDLLFDTSSATGNPDIAFLRLLDDTRGGPTAETLLVALDAAERWPHDGRFVWLVTQMDPMPQHSLRRLIERTLSSHTGRTVVYPQCLSWALVDYALTVSAVDEIEWAVAAIRSIRPEEPLLPAIDARLASDDAALSAVVDSFLSDDASISDLAALRSLFAVLPTGALRRRLISGYGAHSGSLRLDADRDTFPELAVRLNGGGLASVSFDHDQDGRWDEVLAFGEPPGSSTSNPPGAPEDVSPREYRRILPSGEIRVDFGDAYPHIRQITALSAFPPGMDTETVDAPLDPPAQKTWSFALGDLVHPVFDRTVGTSDEPIWFRPETRLEAILFDEKHLDEVARMVVVERPLNGDWEEIRYTSEYPSDHSYVRVHRGIRYEVSIDSETGDWVRTVDVGSDGSVEVFERMIGGTPGDWEFHENGVPVARGTSQAVLWWYGDGERFSMLIDEAGSRVRSADGVFHGRYE